MMILRCALLLAAAVTLSNCCLSSSGCNTVASAAPPLAPTAAPPARAVAAAPVASVPVVAAPVTANAMPGWDGLESAGDSQDNETGSVSPKKHSSRRIDSTDASAQSSYGYRGGSSWDEQQAADRADEARLKQKLIICRNCSAQ
jgi:hypothetical protein